MKKLILEPICLFCEWFHYEDGEPAWSDWTPGSDFEMFCIKNHWDIKDAWKEYHPGGYLGECMTQARDCGDYELSDTAKERFAIAEAANKRK